MTDKPTVKPRKDFCVSANLKRKIERILKFQVKRPTLKGGK